MNELLHSSAARPSTWLLYLTCALVAVFALATFLPAIDNEFVYDDHAFVFNNPAVNVHQTDLRIIPWYRIWLEPYWPREMSTDKLYRPMTTLSFRANAVLTDHPLQPRPFRAINLLLHMLASMGVAVLAWRLTSSNIAGGLAGMLFATHPVHAEAVVTIYGRSELLAGACAAWLLALYIESPFNHRRGAGRIVLCNLLFFVAVASKENAIFLWPILLAIDLWHRRDHNRVRRTFREWLNVSLAPPHVGFMLAAALFLFLRYLVFGWQTRLDPAQTRIYEVPMAHVGTIEHLLTPFSLLWLVVTNLVWPESLCPVWSYPALKPASKLSADVLTGMVSAGGMLFAGALLWYRRKLAGALVIGTLLLLAIPVQAVSVTSWFYAERWLYLPTIPIFVLFSWVLFRGGMAFGIVGLAAALTLMPQSWKYSAVFADDLRMMHEVVVRQPDNFQGRRNYASVLYHRGKYSEAIQAANQCIERFDDVADPYMVLFMSYLEQEDGRRALEAINQYEYFRRHLPGLSLTAERELAMKLIEQSHTFRSGH